MSSKSIKDKNIVYIARATVPSPSTNSVHIAKISEAFAQQCKNFAFIVSQSDKSLNVTDYYGLKQDIALVEVDLHGTKRLDQLIWANRAAKKAIGLSADHIVTRDPFCALFAVLRGVETTLDLHGDLNHLCGRFYRIIKWNTFVNNKKLHLVVISQGLKEYYVQKYGVNPDRIKVLPDGCNLDDFTGYADKELLSPASKLRVGYFGKTLIGKGIDLIRRLAEVDLEDDFEIYGGTLEASEKETGKKFSSNAHFHGHVQNSMIPEIMCDMDVLILPNQDKLMVMGEDIGKFTSPLKLFEYMASGRVIVASDLPVIREVLDESNSYLADSKDENDWKEKLDEIRSNRNDALAKAVKAKSDVVRYTWKNRALEMVNY